MLDYPADGWYNGNIIKAQGMSWMEKLIMNHITVSNGPTMCVVGYWRTNHGPPDSWLVIYL